MGTSTSNPGQKGRSPLIPSWLDESESTLNTDKSTNALQGIPPLADSNRFRQSRGSYTHYLSSGGTDRTAMRRATSQYVRGSVGGSRNAVVRLGSARNSTVRLFNILGSVISNGVDNTIRHFNLQTAISAKASDVFESMVDYICPDGGPTDEGLVRDSFIDTIAGMPELADSKFEDLSEQQLTVFMKAYMANIVFKRLLNDIGLKSINLPSDPNRVERIQKDTLLYIEGAISDAFSQLGISIREVEQSEALSVVDSIYEKTYDVLVEWGEDA